MDEGFTNGKSHSQSRLWANGIDTDREKRYRPRTFPYFKLLPYKVEEETERNVALAEIIKQLYIALKAEDIAPGAVHWTRELRAWLSLKFDITRALRVKLVKLYYMLSLAPGLDLSNGERFESMFRFLLTRKKHHLKPGADLILDWRPLWREIKGLVLPHEMAAHQGSRKRSHKNVASLAAYASQFFDPDMFSRLARDSVANEHVNFSEHGIFTKEQSDLIFTAILRLTEIPVGQATTPYSPMVDMASGLGVYLETDKKRTPVGYTIARWIVMSLSPLSLNSENSILSNLEGLIQSIDTFFHPSNNGNWADILSQTVFHLVDFFLLRWNREQSGEMDTPPTRRITPELKKRFVLILKDVVFMGIFSKRSKILNYYFVALQGLANLEPNLILPGAMQRFYPSLQGLVEVHRTSSSLCSLQMLANVMSKHKGYRCHITALLALALPGIDANDLSKTQYTLNFIQAVAFSIPFTDLTKNHDGIHDTSLAIQWVQGEMERLERDGPNVEIDYDTELSDEDEASILRSSTAGFGEFVLALLGKVFTLLENLPEQNRLRTGAPEENVVNVLPSALTPLFCSLSPDLFDIALEKMAAFINSHVVHQARDAMAFIVNSMCKANPERTIKLLLPMLVVGIRNEIDFNDAASNRSGGSDVLPRDRALVWHLRKCYGLATTHVSNFIHHLLLNLTTIYPVDTALYEPEVFERGLDVSDWGRNTKPSELTIKWHVPSSDEINLAVEIFESQVKTSIEKLDNLTSDSPAVSRNGKNKEWSDEVERALTHIRLMMSGVSVLFDPKAASGNLHAESESDNDITMNGDNPMEGDDDPLAEASEDEETRPQFHYRAGYLLEKDSPAYVRIHKLREDVGHLYCKMHNFLMKYQEDDVPCFTALYLAYKSWITDVGNEKSAHTLERMNKIYLSEIRSFKVTGLRKVYPRPLLIKRAGSYHLQRSKHNASARQKSDLDKELLLNLATSAISQYAEVRVTAQQAMESALKSVIGGRPLVVPQLLSAFRTALETNDFDRIKGCLYTLLFGSLTKTISKDWRFAPELIDLYIKSGSVDKPSIQKVGNTAMYGGLIEFGRRMETLVVLDQALIQEIEPQEDCHSTIKTRNDFIVGRRVRVEEKKWKLAVELTAFAKTAHWKLAGRCTLFINNLGLRVQTLAPPEMIELATLGAVTEHPGLRAAHTEFMTRILNHIETRAIYGHSFEKYIREEEFQPNKLEVPVDNKDPKWTKKFLDSFAEPGQPEYYLDRDWPGWLVWGKSFHAMRADPIEFTDFDELETSARKQIGSLLTLDWYQKFFMYMKQEPRDTSADRFRVQNTTLLVQTFELMHSGLTSANFDDIKEEVKKVYEDGSDKHQHRATAEIVAGLMLSTYDFPNKKRDEVWAFCLPIMLNVFSEGLTPENLTYWVTGLHMVIGGRDPRSSRELFDFLVSFRLDITSNAAFKDSSKIQLLDVAISDAGWHFRNDEPILRDFLDHIDHPYKAVREAIGRATATIYRMRYFEAFRDVDTLLEANKSASSIGIKPYEPTEDFSSTIRDVFKRLEVWRGQRAQGEQTPTSYTNGSKTVLLWLDSTLQSYECTQLISFFPNVFMEQLLHMMDVKEDPELQRLAYHVYRHLPNIPFRAGEDVIYFRRIFLIRPAEQQALFTAVAEMLEDPQLEVRLGASTTLAGMIRCSPIVLRNNILSSLRIKFTQALKKNPMPKKVQGVSTPVNSNTQIIKRHAAVLGLGALVNAFPYATPPPEWMPEVLATLASRAANDAGAIGKTVKSVLADFKKTRQDTWVTDQKYFTPEQLEDLEGVLWKSYFA
ncbi:GPI mannosyltransferase [Botrytis cinerea]